MTRAHFAVATCALLVAASSAHAQSVRVSGASSMRYVELRPFVRDSVPQENTEGTTLLRQLPDGRIVRCIPGEAFCRDVHPGAVVSTVPMMHDLEVSAWGFGEGARLYVQGRARNSFGGRETADLWPRADDAFDLLALYGELERERVRFRLGRQWKVTGLGFYNFDGLAAAYRPATALWVELFGGRSLLRGLNEPRTSSALESVEPFAPPSAGVIGGVQARYRPSPRLAVSGTYQLDVRGNLSELYSELFVSNAVVRLGSYSLEGALEADLAENALNEARLLVRSPPFRQMMAFAEARRYRPYFEQWTIWGAFSPAGFDEARAGLTWANARGRLIVRGEGSFREYNAPGAAESVDEYDAQGWGIGSSVSWSPANAWRVEGTYRIETGFGAGTQNVQVGVTRQLGESGSIALQALHFDRAYEIRIAEGSVAGLGAELAMPLNARTRVIASASAYRHLGRQSNVDWTQRRASLRLEWTVGAEPAYAPHAGGVVR